MMDPTRVKCSYKETTSKQLCAHGFKIIEVHSLGHRLLVVTEIGHEDS